MTSASESVRSANSLSGLLVINKPAGMTSRDVVNRVQRVTKNRKCGHAGTLDPLATGVLVVCLGQATRLVPYVQEMKKRYRAAFRFGWRSDTDDIEGQLEPVEQATSPSLAELQAQLQQWEGDCEQVPPQYSAVRVAGKRAYSLARAGKQVELTARTVKIHRIQLEHYDAPDWEVIIECGSGTYVRSIGRDIGEALHCGAVMTSLCREAIGQFEWQQAVPLEELEPETWQQHLLPPAAAVAELPQRVCNSEEIEHLVHGRPLPLPEAFAAEGRDVVAILNEQGNLIALAEPQRAQRLLKPRRVMNR